VNVINKEVLIEVSARHVHLTQEQVEILFGKGHKLTPKKYLSQPGHFLACERVNLIGEKKTFKDVAILGPVRSEAQVELSLSDCFSLGVNGELRGSGDIGGTSGIRICTDMAEIQLGEGVIVAQRHIHMTRDDAKNIGVKDKELVMVKIETGLGRDLVFADVVIRISEESSLSMHIDTDEGNAAMITGKVKGRIIV